MTTLFLGVALVVIAAIAISGIVAVSARHEEHCPRCTLTRAAAKRVRCCCGFGDEETTQ